MTTNAALASQVTDALLRWNSQLDQLADWLTGSPTGGPNLDGRYPLTNADGQEDLFLCLPAVINQVDGPAGTAEIAQAAAEAAASLAGQHSAQAALSRSLAEAAQAATQTLRDQTENFRTHVASEHAAVLFMRDEVEQYSQRHDLPLTEGDPGTAGQWAYDDYYFYMCVADNTWRRSPLSPWDHLQNYEDRPMQVITQTDAGSRSVDNAVRDTDGTGLLPIQAEVVSGSPTFTVEARVSPSAPWIEIRAAATADYLESISWVPYLQLTVVGSGEVKLHIGEK